MTAYKRQKKNFSHHLAVDNGMPQDHNYVNSDRVIKELEFFCSIAFGPQTRRQTGVRRRKSVNVLPPEGENKECLAPGENKECLAPLRRK